MTDPTPPRNPIWIRVAEVALALIIIGLLVATWLPAIVGRR
jgi:hypothetical protein